MRKGLLLTAFIATLALDMGAGPVFIVFGSIHLGEPSPFPASVWLMVRGILNCFQFVTVMCMCLIVSRSKTIFSRKEQRILIQRILLTHPVSYFYYLILLGGIVWNIIGSCWIATAFRYYSPGFAACYLVCVILSWISSAMSPVFVFFGGLSYSSLKRDPVPSAFHMQLIQSQEYSVDDLLRNISESRTLNIPQILRAGELKPREPFQPRALPASVMSNAQTSSPPEENVKIEFPKRRSDGIVLIHRDYLDMEEPTQQSAWSGASVVNVVDGATKDVVPVRVVEYTRNSEMQSEREEVDMRGRSEEIDKERKEEHEVDMRERREEHEVEPKIEQPAKTKEDEAKQARQQSPEKAPETKKGRKRKAVNPKENIVVVETRISATDAKPIVPSLEIVSSLYPSTEDTYVDISAQMICDLNTGRFEPATVNKNVSVTRIQ